VLGRLRGHDATPVTLLIKRKGQEVGIVVQREPLDKVLARSNLKAEGDMFVPIEEAPVPEIGKPAPILQGTDWRTGKPFTISEAKGQYVLVTFWASWCSYCKDAVPILKKVYHRYGKKNCDQPIAEDKAKKILMIGVSLDTKVKDFENFVKKQEFATIQVFDGDWFSPNSRAYHAYKHGVPLTILIGPDGNIEAWDLKGEEIQKALARCHQ
jgi:thiol-disulfide isomerase/thioredoxin